MKTKNPFTGLNLPKELLIMQVGLQAAFKFVKKCSSTQTLKQDILTAFQEWRTFQKARKPDLKISLKTRIKKRLNEINS